MRQAIDSQRSPLRYKIQRITLYGYWGIRSAPDCSSGLKAAQEQRAARLLRFAQFGLRSARERPWSGATAALHWQWYPTFPKKEGDGLTSVPDLKVEQKNCIKSEKIVKKIDSTCIKIDSFIPLQYIHQFHVDFYEMASGDP